MFDFIKKLTRKPTIPSRLLAPAHAETATNSHLEVFNGDEVGDEAGELALTRYPPFDKGIPLIEIDTLLRSQEDLISRIFRTAGASRDEFEERFTPPIRNLARHIHLLPATATTYFRGTGGLFRMSLEVALNALQTANASVFPISGGVERRFYIQPKWSLAVFLAGLCSQNYRTLNSMVVISRDNQQWAPLLDHLYDWAAGESIDRYHVRWLEDSTVHGAKASGAYSISHIVPPSVLQFLATDNNQIIQSMTAAIAGVETNASENPVTRIVAPIVTRVIAEDLKRSATNYGHLVIGAHLEPHLIDAMRRLVRSGKWIPNQPGGRVWVGREGIFIDWLDASSDISLLLAKDSFAGVPKDPDTLAGLLVNAGLLEMNKGGERYWTITVPITLEVRDTTVKLLQGESIFPHQFDLTPYQNTQLTLAVAPTATTTKTKVRQNIQRAPEAAPDDTVREEPPVFEAGGPDPDEAADLAMSSINAEATETMGPVTGGESAANVVVEKVSAKRNTRRDETSGQKKDGPKPAADGVTVDRLLSSLKPENALVLRSVIEGFHQARKPGSIIFLPYGVGIAHQEMNAHGHPVMDVFEELSSKQWLWVDRAKPSRKIHAVEVEGENLRLMILKTDIATGLGLVDSQ